MVKLRQIAEDFLVTELGGPEPVVGSEFSDSEHRLYRLEKRNHDTIALLARLSRHFQISRRSFGISGFKDRHAITSQMVSLPASKGQKLPTEIGQQVGDLSPDLTGEGWRLTLLGGSDKKLRSGSHSANHFAITVRDINQQQLEGLPRRLEQARIHGWPNWFDTQRFGSAVGHRLPGTHVVAGEYKAAMKLHLTERNKSDRSDKRRDKKQFAAAWPKISHIKPEHKPFSKLLKAQARALEEGVEDGELWRRVYMALPYDIRGIWISAWQSREWNSDLAGIFESHFPHHLLHLVKIGVGGPFLFPEAPSGKRGAPKRHLIADIEETLGKLPKTMEMPHSDLDLTAIDQYLSNHPRPLLINSEIGSTEGVRDEMNSRSKGKRWAITFDFELPPGAYATVLIKRLFH